MAVDVDKFGADEADLILMPTRAQAKVPSTEDVVARLYREQAEALAG